METTVLVADDNAAVRKLTCAFAKHAGYQAIGADCAEEALRLANKQGPIDILITDLVMPDADGFDLAVRMSRVYPSLKVLYMSGYADMRWTGAFLAKPFNAAALTDALAALTIDPRKDP